MAELVVKFIVVAVIKSTMAVESRILSQLLSYSLYRDGNSVMF